MAAQNVDATVEILRELSWVTSALVTDDAADEVNLLEASDLLSKYIELSLAPNTNPAGEETLATILSQELRMTKKHFDRGPRNDYEEV